MQLTHIDLCSGIGGWLLAARWAGFRSLACAEIEPYCCAVLSEQFPEVDNAGDIRNADAFGRFRDRVTVLSMSLPCQPWSLAGQRRGGADDRDLWSAALAVVECVRPAWILYENVPGIIGMGQLDRCCEDLEARGYACQAFVIPAASLGAPHLRERAWLVAHAQRGDCHGRRNGRPETPGLRPCPSADRSGVDAQALADAEGSRIRCGKPSKKAGQLVCDGWWESEPDVGRVAPRVPNRSHRLKALGNAIVPQAAYPLFTFIKEINLT